MEPQFYPRNPNLAIQLATSQSPIISVASYFATFGHISAISSRIWIKEKICLPVQCDLTSYLASHQLVSHNYCGQLFCYFWPYLSHFMSYFNGGKKIGLPIQYNLTNHLARHQLASQKYRGQLFCYFQPDLSHFKSDFDEIEETFFSSKCTI